jgi:pimeloyl-ACP methyl ester carboxylesterase
MLNPARPLVEHPTRHRRKANLFLRIGFFLCGMKFKGAVLIGLFLACTVAGCNIPRMMDKAQYRSFRRMGMAPRVFRDSVAERWVHSGGVGTSTIVFVPGYGASGPGQYRGVAKELRKEYRLVFPDMLTFGRSRYTGTSHTLEDQVEHLRLLLDSLGIAEGVTLVGNSYGGIVCSRFAMRYPQRVSTLFLYDSPASCYSRQYADSLALSLGLSGIDDILSPPTPQAMMASLKLILADPPYIPRFVRRQFVELGVLKVRDQQLKFIHDLQEREAFYNAQSMRFSMPVHLIWGEKDELIPLSTAFCIAEKAGIPYDKVHIITEGRHAPNIDFCEEFCAIIRKSVPH